MKKILILDFFIIIILSACIINNNSTVVLWSDKPEMAAYVEEFNSTQSKFRIEIVYKKDPGTELARTDDILSTNSVDLIISEYLNSPGIIEQFTPIDSFFGEGKMDLSIFYPKLLELGYKEKKLHLLPISFNLPTVMFKKATESKDIPAFFMNPLDMENAVKNFNLKSNINFQVMGFSPLWESEVLFLNAVLAGANFQIRGTELLSWDKQKLLDSLKLSVNWSKEINGGFEKEEEFTTKFLYDPPYKLIAGNRILFYYTDLVSFFDLPPDKRKDLDYRWLSFDDKIPVSDDILFSGIPIGAKNQNGAIEFIYWFFNQDTQKKLLKSTQIKRMDTFGFANGFSSLHEVNKNELPISYPTLVGYIPPESSLIFPEPLPFNWSDLKTKVIKPWLKSQIKETPPEISLQQAIDKWLKQKPVD